MTILYNDWFTKPQIGSFIFKILNITSFSTFLIFIILVKIISRLLLIGVSCFGYFYRTCCFDWNISLIVFISFLDFFILVFQRALNYSSLIVSCILFIFWNFKIVFLVTTDTAKKIIYFLFSKSDIYWINNLLYDYL